MFGHVFEISVCKQSSFQIHAATLPHPSDIG